MGLVNAMYGLSFPLALSSVVVGIATWTGLIGSSAGWLAAALGAIALMLGLLAFFVQKSRSTQRIPESLVLGGVSVIGGLSPVAPALAVAVAVVVAAIVVPSLVMSC